VPECKQKKKGLFEKKESFQKTSQQAARVRISVDAVGFAPAGIIVIFFSAGLNGVRMQTKKKRFV